MLVSCLACSSTLKMEAAYFSEKSVGFQRTARRYITEDKTLQIRCYLQCSEQFHEKYLQFCFLCMTWTHIAKAFLSSDCHSPKLRNDFRWNLVLYVYSYSKFYWANFNLVLIGHPPPPGSLHLLLKEKFELIGSQYKILVNEKRIDIRCIEYCSRETQGDVV
jgi:hypothetical protein